MPVALSLGLVYLTLATFPPFSSSWPLLCRVSPGADFPLALFRFALCMLLLSLALDGRVDWRATGATETSAPGAILTKDCVLAGAGVKDVTLMFAVAVDVRCKVSGCK